MATTRNDDLTDLLRARGVRKRMARKLGALDGNSRRAGAKGEKLARQAVVDLTAAVDDIRKRVLSGDPKRRLAARKAAQTRKRTSAQQSASAKKTAQTRGRVVAAKATPTRKRTTAQKTASAKKTAQPRGRVVAKRKSGPR